MSTLCEQLAGHAQDRGQTIALKGDAETLTYGELYELALGLAGRLRQEGVAPGDRVTYQVANSPLATVLYFGVLVSGAVAVPLNPLLAERDVDRARARLSPRISFNDKSRHQEVGSKQIGVFFIFLHTG